MKLVATLLVGLVLLSAGVWLYEYDNVGLTDVTVYYEYEGQGGRYQGGPGRNYAGPASTSARAAGEAKSFDEWSDPIALAALALGTVFVSFGVLRLMRR